MASRAISLFCAFLSACDAWPTTVDNRSGSTIQFTWYHGAYDHWSAPFDLPRGKAMPFALDHRAADFAGVHIQDGRHTYALTPEAIARLHHICSRSAVDRSLSLGGNCWLTYYGNGLVTVSRQAAPGVRYEYKYSEN